LTQNHFWSRVWNPEMDLHTESIKSLPLWVQLPDLDVKYWGQNSLSKIGSILGIPIKTHKYTRDRSMLKYARLLIDVNLEGPFPDFVEFFNENGVLIRQQVIFEWRPRKCSHCLMYAHEEVNCRKKEKGRKEWRQISQKGNVAIATPPLTLYPGIKMMISPQF